LNGGRMNKIALEGEKITLDEVLKWFESE